MLTLENLNDYIKKLNDCISVQVSIDTTTSNIVLTTETYQYDLESQANARIGALKDHPGFISCKKQFVPAKEKKGEIVEDEYWKLAIKIKHQDY